MNRFLKGIFTCCAVCLVLEVPLIPTQPSELASDAIQERASARARRVEELFNQNCARCHGVDGRSDTPRGHLFNAPDFTDPDWWKKNSSLTGTRTLRSIVVRGRAGMPGFGKKLTQSEINLLVDRIRSFRKLERKS